jgi:hypothetical protein
MATVLETALDVVGDASSTVLGAVAEGVDVVGGVVGDLVAAASGDDGRNAGGGKKWIGLLLIALVVLGVVWWKRSSSSSSDETPERANT